MNMEAWDICTDGQKMNIGRVGYVYRRARNEYWRYGICVQTGGMNFRGMGYVYRWARGKYWRYWICVQTDEGWILEVWDLCTDGRGWILEVLYMCTDGMNIRGKEKGKGEREKEWR
jgi:hypothetical protein